ncbi:site-specific integrase [Streptomyces bobili]|uniref:hypothetical protein n=1 Tax=Streptomyces bobili TaxID=67280 RepID=UPI003721BD2A
MDHGEQALRALRQRATVRGTGVGKVLVWLGVGAGLRLGEALGMRRRLVVWQAGLLRIVEQRRRGKAVRLKTKASYATLPVDRFLIERLAQHTARYSGPEPALPYAGHTGQERGPAEPVGEDLIVTNRAGPRRSQRFPSEMANGRETSRTSGTNPLP